jgi:hypothetical protein
MNIAQIENNIKALVEHLASGELATNDFIYELLLAYGHRNSTISMLKTGHYNIAKEPDEIIFKRHLYFKEIKGEALHSEIDRMKNEKLVLANRTRFVIATNFHTLLAVDTKTGDSLDIALTELPKKFDFFLPWAGMEKAVYQGENPADVKAAEKMAKLFDLIKADNFTEKTVGDKVALHHLNVFLTRLLFCFFAEDTEIFADNQFSNAIQAHTNEDGSDLAEYLNRLFSVLNTSENERGVLPEYLAEFPYVNGGLFADSILTPKFSRKSRRMLIECGSELNWSDINPDIFGSMIQAVVHPDQRGGMGMHYTSVTNIMKVIEPLFLNDLYDEVDKASHSAVRLQKLQQRLGEIKIFDPACGSGNFLIIAYKELRRLEMDLIKLWQEIELQKSGQVLQPFSVIKLSQFYGIELDDFAHEVAILSLWLAEHQMNNDFQVEFGKNIPSLPLKNGGNIVNDNATRIIWSEVCEPNDESEVYVLGNPPYVGARNQSESQKQDMARIFDNHPDYKDLDYVACWMILAARYINRFGGTYAFVTTNSICQGEQVAYIWKRIFDLDLQITFAQQSFKWSNNAKANAGVTCIIVGVSKKNDSLKTLINPSLGLTYKVKNISPYLTSGPNIFVSSAKASIAGLPKMVMGNMPRDGGHLILNETEKNEIVKQYPESVIFFRKLYGTQEFIKGQPRWALWVDDQDLEDACKIEPIKNRIDSVYKFRMDSDAKTTNQYAKIPHKFAQRCLKDSVAIMVPNHTSERREYVPIGFMPKDVVITNSANAVFDAELYIFALISSKAHMIWIRAIGGQLETRLRYSAQICYNTFPVPKLTNKIKDKLNFLAIDILEAREAHPDKNIEYLYDPDSMPINLLEAHKRLDQFVDQLFFTEQKQSDEDRLSALLVLYKDVTGGQNA